MQHLSSGALTPPQEILVLSALERPVDFTLQVSCTYKHFIKRLALFPPLLYRFWLLKCHVIFPSPEMHLGKTSPELWRWSWSTKYPGVLQNMLSLRWGRKTRKVTGTDQRAWEAPPNSEESWGAHPSNTLGSETLQVSYPLPCHTRIIPTFQKHPNVKWKDPKCTLEKDRRMLWFWLQLAS